MSRSAIFVVFASCFFAVLFAFSANSFAVPIPIENASFEEPPFTGTFSSSDTDTFWNFGGARGRYNFDNASYPSNTAPTGSFVAYSNGSGNNIVQVVGELEANSIYTYTLMVGDGPGSTYGGYEMELQVYNETTDLWEDVAAASGAADASIVNEFFEAELVFETGDSLIGASGQELIGGDLRIRFSGGNGVQTVFDDVALDIESIAAVPEPANLLVWGIVAGVALIFNRRRRN